jgi:uncharacterized membrane protein YeaQ/YmgE (transglycosylase-associated protein family)
MDYFQYYLQLLLKQDYYSLGITIATGFAVGLVARILFPGKDPLGVFGTSLLGIVGAIMGLFLLTQLSSAGLNIPFKNQPEIYQLFAGLLGSLILLAVLRIVRSA